MWLVEVSTGCDFLKLENISDVGNSASKILIVDDIEFLNVITNNLSVIAYY